MFVSVSMSVYVRNDFFFFGAMTRFDITDYLNLN